MTAAIRNILPQPYFAPPNKKRESKKLLTSFPTPQKYYPLGVDVKSKKISVFLSPKAKKQEDAIYKFRQKSTGKCYIGIASKVSERVSGHLYNFRHPRKEGGQSALAQAVRKNPKDFEFGILVTKDKVENLEVEEMEAIYIEYHKAKGPLFNKRKGGGGGARKKATANKRTQKEVSEKVKALYHTPKKSYKLDSTTYKVLLTPSAKGDIYIIKRVSKLNGKDNIKRYIGKTERAVKKRLSEHSHYTRHAEKIRGQKELYKEMRKFPSEFEVKLLNSQELTGDDPCQIETGLIEFFKENNKLLYNANRGGGGGQARKRLF